MKVNSSSLLFVCLFLILALSWADNDGKEDGSGSKQNANVEQCSKGGTESGSESDSGSSDCGCSATSRKHVKDDDDDQATVEVEDPESAEHGEGEPSSKSEVKYTAAANAVSPYPRTHQMVKIEGGAFMMGTDNPIIYADGEHPARKATLSTFWLDVHEVSNAEFELFVNSTGYVTEVLFVNYYSLETSGSE